ncbi:hypothetical protein M378DRAFT_74252 [Amanita muscaria Koide BX008]|uniref:Vacuolar membrane-associated protein IML1 n=1 Tax=Amanita muscaria (strain Koide BX008) TaxID=946122 RepID=A0A0C2SUL2_AMAMK|nr:hypothetical protein M378DRAFT_74252 [Amanita muscaria Koide BX008]
MTGSRAESQQPHYGRRRSNTTQSILRPLLQSAGPIKIGESKVLNLWVHDIKDSEPSVILFNHSWWPGVAEGDLLRVMSVNSNADSSFLFVVPKDDGLSKPQLQISVPKPMADGFRLRNNEDVTITKVDRSVCSADYVEFVFQDQYLGRNEMWRLSQHLVDQCIYTNEEISFIGAIAAKISAIYIDGKKVSSACVTTTTKAIYRSLSAKVTIFIQVCQELWEFAGDGERFNEKIIHSFLPALFNKWKEAGTNHTVTIVLISRVYYDESEREYAAGPLRQDDQEKWYKDFYKIITDLEVIYEWKPTLVSLKNSFWDFQRDILLAHHYHQAMHDSAGPAPPVRLVGRLSYAHDGPILEALNLALNPTENHYIDRSLSHTGSMTLIISPGMGYFRVSKKLLRLTTTRILDQGFLVNLVLLTKPPLHQSPIFSFQGVESGPKAETHGKFGPHTFDPLWDGDDESGYNKTNKKTYWWEPFWVSTIYWDIHKDLPIRNDRFVPRAKMQGMQMLGLLGHTIYSSIELPYLPPMGDSSTDPSQFHAEADKFDLDIFNLKGEVKREPSSTPLRNHTDRRQRNSTFGSGFHPIEESPKKVLKELPSRDLSETTTVVSLKTLSKSSSRSSLQSNNSHRSSASARPAKGSLASKLTPAWLFNPFRSAPSEPQTSQVSASAIPSRIGSIQTSRSETTAPPSNTVAHATPRVPPAKPPSISGGPAPLPMAIRKPSSTLGKSSVLSRTLEEDTHLNYRASYVRRSPVNTPPRDEGIPFKRRSYTNAIVASSASPGSATNPTQNRSHISYTQSSLARRWQHMLPQKLHKHDMKLDALVIPPCLPLTVEYFPSQAELDHSYEVFSYDFVVDPSEMRSFFVKPPSVEGNAEEVRRAWALAVMRGMAAVRLAQGFQFVVRSPSRKGEPEQQPRSDEKPTGSMRRFLALDEDSRPKPAGAAEVLRGEPDTPVYLSMSNEIHRISYTGEAIQVRRYVRRMVPAACFEYQCLIWPKLGGGYTELSTNFSSHGLENYGWNRIDMLVAGYEQNFNESMRYWRTRFILIPTTEPPMVTIGPAGEKLNDEEVRLLGMEKFAEQLTKMRWHPPDERQLPQPIRFLPTTLDPVASILDDSLMEQLDAIHAAGPLKKKMKSEREIGDMSLSAIAKVMREEDGVPIKNNHWHRAHYPNSFTGFDFVSWLVREFRDVSSRVQAAEWGVKLQEQGLLEHCRGFHGFLDGHYFYRLKGEYSVPMTPKGWFIRRYANDDGNTRSPTNAAKPRAWRRNKKRLILSQSMVTDVDLNKRSDQAESVVLHHDIIHNPATVFHIELHWIGATARCIEDTLRAWNRAIDRYGLRLVEAYVTQIHDIRDHNAFQSCFPLRLAVPPPVVPDLEKRVPEATQTEHYFEYALLRRFGFILDVEAAGSYPDQIDVMYSYRRSPYHYSQFVHRSGVAFVQVLGGSEGFIFLINRLIGPGRMGATKSKDNQPSSAAEELRIELNRFCSEPVALNAFYEEELANLGPSPDEPPPLVL